MPDFELGLYDNAIDSIVHAIEHYTSDLNETRKYKYAIIHLAQGVTLLLKERLRREHPQFIFRRVETNPVAEEIITVNVQETLNRLKGVAGIDLGIEADTVRRLTDLRNTIEHYEVSITQEDADIIIAQTIPFIARFVDQELARSFQNDIGKEVWDTLLQIQGYFRAALQLAEDRIRSEKLQAYRCPRCNANTVVQQSRFREDRHWGRSTLTCIVCHSWIASVTNCRRCRKVITLSVGMMVPHYSYCLTCQQYARTRFADTEPHNSLYEYVAEVERWFQAHDLITVEELYRLVENVATVGSSIVSYPVSLYRSGVIDFAYENQRIEYERLNDLPGLPGRYGFASHYAFRWVFQPQ
jgi:hypothetical protein